MESSKGGKVVAGFRPVRVVGAEISMSTSVRRRRETLFSERYYPALTVYSFKGKANATVLTALLFIPDPSPSFDVYGKVGVAKLEESFDVATGLFPPRAAPRVRVAP